MKSNVINGAVLLVTGFSVGVLVAHFPRAIGAEDSATDMSRRQFVVFIDEIRQNFVFGDEFSGHYAKTVTLSDGSRRNIELTPMIREGRQVVEFKDTGGHTYMGLNGTTTNDKLMVQVGDVNAMRALLKSEGWSVPGH